MEKIANYNKSTICLFSSVETIGDYFIHEFTKTIKKQSTITIALSGGNTPQKLFEYWASLGENPSVWNHVYFYWVDERMVPHTSPESNYGVAKKLFFDPLQIPIDNVFPMEYNEFAVIEAERYSQLLLTKLPVYRGFPVFDFMFLGIGDDGHTASIFPGNTDSRIQTAVCLDAKNPYSLQNRVSLSFATVTNAKSLYFFVLGESKKDIVLKVLTQKETLLPASVVIQNHKNYVITDISALIEL